MRVFCLFAVLLAGAACSFSGSSGDGDGDGDIDAATIDAGPDGPVATMDCTDWTPSKDHFDPCMIPAPMGLEMTMAGPYLLDTTDGSLEDPMGNTVLIATAEITQAGVEPALLISVTDLNIGSQATLRAFGDRPVIIASFSRMRIDGSISVSSAINSNNGAGANSMACIAATPGTDDNSPAERGGGGGGGFGAIGGNGGDGNDGASNAEGTGGGMIGEPPAVHGGCPGARGGGNMGGSGGGGQGNGGGAIYLSAFSSIRIGGEIAANGGGGLTTGSTLKGGGGAGSGGFIGLDARSVMIQASASLSANGGGGGEGNGDGGQVNGADGAPGLDGALGGAMSTDGGDGGLGGAGAVPAGGNGINGAKGGGGGGGSVGFIAAYANTVMAISTNISPPLAQP